LSGVAAWQETYKVTLVFRTISQEATRSSELSAVTARLSGVGDSTMAIKLKLGDKVRSLGGVEGEIVGLNDDRRSVSVKVPGKWRGDGIVSIPVVRLRPIAEYSWERKRPRRTAGDLLPRLLA
jgi:hypothetical protein